jgi:hypothetical protein
MRTNENDSKLVAYCHTCEHETVWKPAKRLHVIGDEVGCTDSLMCEACGRNVMIEKFSEYQATGWVRLGA